MHKYSIMYHTIIVYMSMCSPADRSWGGRSRPRGIGRHYIFYYTILYHNIRLYYFVYYIMIYCIIVNYIIIWYHLILHSEEEEVALAQEALGLEAALAARHSERGDDTVGNPHRARISQFELFELALVLKLDKRFPVEQFEATVSQSTVSSHPPRNGRAPMYVGGISYPVVHVVYV